MDLSPDIGLERLQRAFTLLMAANINDAIDEQNTLWAPRDASFFAAMGIADPGFSVEHIQTRNIHSGTIPSLITSPESDFPNLCVIAYIASPSESTDDWMDHYSITLAAEFMVKSLSDEELVNARIQRTLEAGNSVLTSDINRHVPEIDGVALVPQISGKPTVTISDVFVRHTSGDPNARSFYQHGSLTYRIDKWSGF